MVGREVMDLGPEIVSRIIFGNLREISKIINKIDRYLCLFKKSAGGSLGIRDLQDCMEKREKAGSDL